MVRAGSRKFGELSHFALGRCVDGTLGLFELAGLAGLAGRLVGWLVELLKQNLPPAGARPW